MTKIQNSKPVSVIWYWNLKFVCNLVLEVWDFIDSITPTSCRMKVIHVARPMPVIY